MSGFFRCRSLFGSDRNGLRIDEALLTNYRLPPSSRYVTAVLKAHAETLLAKLDSSQSMRGKVENLLMPMLRTRDANIDLIARTLGLSRQTLFRRLQAEGRNLPADHGRAAPEGGASVSPRAEGLSEGDSLSGRVLRPGRFLARLQAVDGIKPQ